MGRPHPVGLRPPALGEAVVSLALLLTATFFMIHLVPGDPVRAALGPTAPASLVAERKAALGLDKPLVTQYVDYVRDVLHGDFGTSLTSGESVTEVIQQRGPSTLKLGSIAFLVAILIAVPLGILMAALTRDSKRRGVELGFTATTGAIGAIPSFLIAVALVYLFAVTIHLFPVAGRAASPRTSSRSPRSRSHRSPRSRASSASKGCACSTRITSAPPAASGFRRGSCTSATRCRTR